MATWSDIAQVAGELDGVHLSGASPQRFVECSGQRLAWERPYTKADIRRETARGQEIYAGTVLAVHTPDVMTAAAYAQMEPSKYFQTVHFMNYPAVLCRLELLSVEDLRELLYEARLARVIDRGLG